MKTKLLLLRAFLLLAFVGGASSAWATVYTAADGNALMNYVNGTNATLVDGDIIELTSSSNYNKRFGIPHANITIRAAAGYSPVINTQLYWKDTEVDAVGGGITFENVKINLNNRFLSIRDKELDIETITFRNCEITGLTNQLIYGGNADKTINSIVLDNCVIHDCTSGRLIETTHAVNSITVTNCTIYKGANSFFYNNIDRTSNIAFAFTNNTVYDWGTNHLFQLEKDYGSGSTYVIKDNIFYWSSTIAKWIITMNGTNNPSGTITSQKNLIQGIYGKTENDYNQAGLSLDAAPFVNTTAGSEDFSIELNNKAAFATSSTVKTPVGVPALWKYTWGSGAVKAGTLILPFNATIPSGVTAYTLHFTAGNTAASAEKITSGVLPANTPVLLNAEAASTNYTFVATGEVPNAVPADLIEGALNGVLTESKTLTSSDNAYVLQNGDEGLGFYKVNKTDITVNPFRAYLVADGVASRININFGDETTGVNLNVNDNLNGKSVMYNMSGLRVGSGYKGLVIKNGKKHIIK